MNIGDTARPFRYCCPGGATRLDGNSQDRINSAEVGTMIEARQGYIDYDASGIGPTIVLVPGSCSTGGAWRPVMSHLASGFRCVTTSLLGYGGTVARRTDADPDISHEAEVVESFSAMRTARCISSDTRSAAWSCWRSRSGKKCR